MIKTHKMKIKNAIRMWFDAVIFQHLKSAINFSRLNIT